MANSIDWTVLGLGTLIGIGCKNQLRAAAKVAATTAASLAGVAAATAQQVAAEAQSPEEAAAAERLQRMDQQLQQQLNGNGKNG